MTSLRRSATAALCFLSLGIAGPAIAAKKVLTVMSWQLNETKATQAWFQHAKETFESRHPEVEIQLTTAPWGEEYRQKVLVAAVGGAAPDVVHLSIVWARELYERGALLPLNPYISRDRTALNLSDFVPVTQQYNQKDGVYFGMTSAMDEGALLYNVDLFEQAGLDPGSTAIASWDDFKSYARKLTRSEGGKVVQWAYTGGASPEVFNSWFVANGGSFYTPRGLTGFSSARGIQTARFLNELYGSPGYIGGNFNNRTAAMTHGGNWSPYFLQQQASDLRYNLTSYPKGPSGTNRGTTTWGNMYSITKNTKHPDLAWEFVRYYTSLEALIDFFQMVNYVGAPRISFYRSDVWLGASRKFEWMPNIPQIALVGGVYPYIRYSELASKVWGPLVEPALQGKKPIESTFDEAERLYDQILQREPVAN